MRLIIKKKVFCLVISFILVMLTYKNEVRAHNYDFWRGVYATNATCQPTNMRFRITTSAQTSMLNSNVYDAGYDWNEISSNVHISNILMEIQGMPYISGFYYVYGRSFSATNEDGTAGQTVMYSNGSVADVDSDWQTVAIFMNTDNVFPNTTAAKKAFTHEVGHALKLAHPECSVYAHGTRYGGYPQSIMNQGLANSLPYVASTIQEHDTSNLKQKWGD